jgi:adenosylcobyric acid synthase
MLAETIHDEVESGDGTVAGLGLLPVGITFEPRKTLARPAGEGLGAPVRGYEIHHGVVSRGEPSPLLRYADGRPEGAVAGNVSGTHWHGAFESDEFRRRFLAEAARQAGRHGFTVAPGTRFAAVRERALDVLGDLVEEHLDTEALRRLIEQGPPPGLRFVPPGAQP